VRILILGTSGSAGDLYEDPSTSWALRLQDAVSADIGPVEVFQRMFSPNGERALVFLERLLAEHHPDVVIAYPNTYAFVMSDVEECVRQRFGKRTARVFRVAERGFASTSGHLGPPGRAAVRGAKAATRRVVGTASLLDAGLATQSWLDTLDRLARAEAVDAIILGATFFGAEFQQAYPGATETTRAFNRLIEERCLAHHFAWLDGEAAMRAAPGGRDACYGADSVHKTRLGNDQILGLVTGALRERQARV
jgi:hypothetical protein